MIEADHKLLINTPIIGVWDYVQDINRWAAIFPGCRECIVIDEHNSQWILKVGVGGLVRTVKVLVRVDQWDGPEKVDFSFELEAEPVVGSGSYTAIKTEMNTTEVNLQVSVSGSGQMAPMWEAMCRPLLPQLAKSFANALKAEIETIAGVTPVKEKTSVFVRFSAWLRNLWQYLLGARQSDKPG